MLKTITSTLAPVHRAGWPFLAIGVALTLGGFLVADSLGWVLVVLTGWIAYFFRDPDRVTPTRPGLVVSPADGRVQLIMEAAPPPELAMGDEPMMAAAKKSRSNGLNQLAHIQDAGWKPELSLASRAKAASAVGDARLAAWLCEELLAIDASLDAGVRGSVAAFLARERREAGIEMEAALLDHPQAEAIARRAAHFVLSLPESQLN